MFVANFTTVGGKLVESYKIKMLAPWLLLVGAGCIIKLLLPSVRKYGKVFSSLWGMPGPRNYFLGGVGNVWEMRNRHKTIEVLHSWVEKFGGICKLGGFPVPMVLLSSPEYAQKLYGSKETEHLTKPFIYDLFRPLLLDGLFTSSGDKWRSHRQPMSYINSFKNLQSYMEIFNKESYQLVSHLETFSEENEGKASPILHLLTKSTLFSITEALFGKSLEDEDPQIVDEVIENLNKFKGSRDGRFEKPWLAFHPIYRLFPLSRRVDKVTGKLHEYWRNKIKEFKEELEHQSGVPLVKQMMDFNEVGVLEEVLTMTVAGYETTGMTLQLLLFFLALHPHHQNKCRQEVDQLLSDVDKCPNGDITQQHLSCLKHLERCLMETLRFFPAVYAVLRELDAPLKLDEDITLLPGTQVAVIPREIHMNPKYYPNPEKFDPGRFVPEECRARHPYAYFPFAGGPRKCIGFKFATLQIVVASSRILHKYFVTTSHKFEEIRIVAGMMITTDPNVSFQFIKRLESQQRYSTNG